MSAELIGPGLVVTVLLAILGWWGVTVWSDGKRRDLALRQHDKDIADLRLHVAEEYVQKDDLHQMFRNLHDSIAAQFGAVRAQFDKMDARFDKLESHLDRKQDKS